jgi:hypothetical protein
LTVLGGVSFAVSCPRLTHPNRVTPTVGTDPRPCVDAVIACGDRITDTTLGAPNHRIDTRDYERWFCIPPFDSRDHAGERTYALHIPPGYSARLDFRSKIPELSVAALAGVSCLETQKRLPSGCEMWPKEGQRETLILKADLADEWFVVVEGTGETEGSFELDVTCHGPNKAL